MTEKVYTLANEIDTEFGTATHVIENQEGEWLAFDDDGIYPVQDNGEYLPAPKGWEKLVKEEYNKRRAGRLVPAHKEKDNG